MYINQLDKFVAIQIVTSYKREFFDEFVNS